MAKRQSTSDSSYFTRLGMEVELQRLEERAAQLRAWLGKLPTRGPVRPATFVDGGVSPFRSSRRRLKRTMSAEARQRISEAQKARWAKQKGELATTASDATPSQALPLLRRRNADAGGRA